MAVLLIQARFFCDKRMVMLCGFVIVDDQRYTKNDENSRNDIRDDRLENKQLIDAEKHDEAAQRN